LVDSFSKRFRDLESLKAQIQALKASQHSEQLSRRETETGKAELEYNLRASEYNVEILKNQNENLQTELDLVKKQNSKHRRLCRVLKDKYDVNSKDLASYKEQYKTTTKSLGKRPAPSESLNDSMLIDLNDSIFRDSPVKTDVGTDRVSAKELETKARELTEVRGKLEESQLQVKSLEAKLNESMTTAGSGSAAKSQRRQPSRGRPTLKPG
jgi:hypothetical protein